MAALMRLPAYEANAQLDFSPVNRLIDTVRQQRNQDREFGLQQEQMGMQRERFGMERERFDREKENEVKRRIGGLALLTLQAPEAERAAKWQQVLSLHPEAAKLGPQYGDHRTGPIALLADAGMTGEYLGYKLKQQESGMAAGRLAEQKRFHDAQIANMLELRRLQQDDVARRSATGDLEQQIMRSLIPNAGAGAPSPSSAVPRSNPNIQPQSFQGAPSGLPGVVVEDPNFVRTQAADDDQPQIAAPAGDGMIDTPFGKMTAADARAKAGQLMMVPRFAQAGKALMDSIPRTSLGKEAGNEIDKKQINTQESLARLNTIQSTFKPEFQTIEDRLGYAWTDFASKFRAGQAVVTPDQERSLAEFSAYRSDAINNLNQYIKEITGAAMTNAEASRIMRAMPNPGEGIFDGDSPVAFKSKLDAAIYSARLAIARYNYMRANGFTGNADEAARRMTLESVPATMNRRGTELRQQIQQANPGVRPENLRPLVEQQLRKEFGINI